MKSLEPTRSLKLLACGLIVASVANVLHAVVFTATPQRLYDLFPRNTQGENGIRLQGRAGNTYSDLQYTSDYAWKCPGQNCALPFIARLGISGQIAVLPYAQPGVGTNHGVIRVSNDGGPTRIRIQGSAFKTSGSVAWYIYKGATNWNAPLWQSTNDASFDLTVALEPGAEIFFAVDPLYDHTNDIANWQDISFTAEMLVPTSGSAALWNYFPQAGQGQNGIWLQRLIKSTGTYVDLDWGADYYWYTAGRVGHYYLPFVQRTTDRILAEPYGLGPGTEEMAVIRVVLGFTAQTIQITGTACAFNYGSVIYRIYKGATNWSNPLWQGTGGPQGGSGETFNIYTSCNPGDELFFAVDPNVYDYDDHAAWKDVTITMCEAATNSQIYTAVEVVW
ncbi:MAG: hypothetical protein RMH97_10615, partial [Verrucomicrobiales bacterium]|nr:hypothetical protein [Verrucomicrobiales bacterium]